MNFNPVNTKWSVAAFNNDGKREDFHPTPWEFHEGGVLNAANLWKGTYKLADYSYQCEIPSSDQWKLYFLTENTFVAVKNGSLYRFGKKI
eukprot:TRINITY_DN3930_c0_g1_i1.p1 TRINITY_DN3930_c0_g1~~TRINITY_DN3930_c0_g1_i1.p1  ORF type:complete len:104 (-),score=33.25 TRINITY_DN3930_c0_g1_i1:85-354(-)